MAISVQYGTQKFTLFIFSLLFLAMGIYPLISNFYPQINVIKLDYLKYILLIIAILQLIFVIRMKRPKIF